MTNIVNHNSKDLNLIQR